MKKQSRDEEKERKMVGSKIVTIKKGKIIMKNQYKRRKKKE